jgi:hypothetical protein
VHPTCGGVHSLRLSIRKDKEMKVENIATGCKVRISRKLKKEIKKLGWTVSGYCPGPYYRSVWINSLSEWFPIYAIKR